MKNIHDKKWKFVAINFLGWNVADSPGEAIEGIELHLGEYPDSYDYPETEEGEEKLDQAQQEYTKQRKERLADVSLWIIPEGEEMDLQNYQLKNGILLYNNYGKDGPTEMQNLLIASNADSKS